MVQSDGTGVGNSQRRFSSSVAGAGWRQSGHSVRPVAAPSRPSDWKRAGKAPRPILQTCDRPHRCVGMQRGKDRCPVSEAWTAISAVSVSRISRPSPHPGPDAKSRAAHGQRSADAGVNLRLTDPFNHVFDGTSTVRMLREWLFSSCNPAYSWCFCRNPSAPSPERCRAVCVQLAQLRGQLLAKPQTLQRQGAWFLSSSRSTTRSPQAEGMWRHARQSPGRPATAQYVHPAHALFGNVQPRHHLDTRHQQQASLRPGRSISCNVPSTRKRSPDSFQTSQCGYPKRLL